MKTGTSLESLKQEVERLSYAKKDFISPVDKLDMRIQNNADGSQIPELSLRGADSHYPLTTLAHTQLAEYLDIPTAYYKRMLAEEPRLLAQNVNVWLPEKKVYGKRHANGAFDRRMVRTLDGKVRALLSDTYRRLENEALLEAALDTLDQIGVIVISAQITDTRLYIKALDKRIERDIPTGQRMGDGSHTIFDTVCPIVVVSNSEVGSGALSIETGVFTRGCTNLAIFDAKMRKFHTGARAELSDEAYALLSDDTKRLTDAAVWAQARDLIKAGFQQAKFDADVQRLTEATEQPIEGDPVQVLDRVATRFSFTESTKKGVLRRLFEGGDMTRYGIHAAVTRHSADEEDYDEATRLERVGGQIIELPRQDWKVIAETEVRRHRRAA